MNPEELTERLAAVEIDAAHVRFRDDAELAMYLTGLDVATHERIGQSREGRPIHAVRFGAGEKPVSIVAGSHADEPAGPMTAQALPLLLHAHFPEVLERFRFHVIPQINPDGAERNRPWFHDPPDFETYAQHAIREQPGDDIEFGFADEAGARPENRAVARYLKRHAPFAAHFSLHGMGFAEGAWFLLCREWVERCGPVMDALESLCQCVGMPLHDIDRQGEKGFTRIRPGFATTPTSTAMRAFFEQRGDPETAAKFLPSSMEYVAALGGGPLCAVSEIPLFASRVAKPACPTRCCFDSGMRSRPRVWREGLRNWCKPMGCNRFPLPCRYGFSLVCYC